MKSTIDENKKQEQDIVLSKWKDNNYRGSWFAITGCGKTRAGIIAASEFIRRDNNEKSLVIVPTENLRDNEWEQSFVQWGYGDVRKNVEIVCIQTAYKWSARHYNTVVIDEVHLALSEQYGNFLRNNKFDRILCLTATEPEDENKLDFLLNIAPVIWRTPIQRARELKLVAPTLTFNLAIELNEDERKLYNEVDAQFKLCEQQLGGNRSAFEVSSRFLRLQKIDKNGSNMRVYTPEQKVIYANEVNDITIHSSNCRLLTEAEVKQVLHKINTSRLYWRYMRERKRICVRAANKIAVTAQICNRYSDRQTIIFSELVEIADEVTNFINGTNGITCLSYHSKVKDREGNLKQFKENVVNRLSTVKALNTGADFPMCSLGIATGGDSKQIARIQRTGRVSRYLPDKIAYFVNLYCKDTQEVVWTRYGTRYEEVKWIENINELPDK